MELVVLAMVAGLGFASYAFWKRARDGVTEEPAVPSPPAALSDGERTPQTIQLGDVVSHLGSDYVVEGILTLSEDGRVLRLYRMTDGALSRWLGARPDDEGGALLLDAPADLAVDATGPESLSYQGISYRLTGRRLVEVHATGTFDRRPPEPGERVRLYEYAGAGAMRIFALTGGERVDAFHGERLPGHAIEILPGR